MSNNIFEIISAPEEVKPFFINDENIADIEGLKLKEVNVSPPVLKSSEINPEGRHGTIDTTYAVYPDVRYEDRYITVRFVITKSSKDEALELIKLLDSMILGKELKIKRSLTAPFYFSGRAEKGVEWDIIHAGNFECKLVCRVFPLSILSYDNNFLWDDIEFDNYWFNDYNHSLTALQVKTIDFYIPDPRPAELVVYASVGGVIWNGTITLQAGLNYLPIIGVAQPYVINLTNTKNFAIDVNIALDVGVLEYV